MLLTLGQTDSYRIQCTGGFHWPGIDKADTLIMPCLVQGMERLFAHVQWRGLSAAPCTCKSSVYLLPYSLYCGFAMCMPIANMLWSCCKLDFAWHTFMV